jgi:hypothetical protein
MKTTIELGEISVDAGLCWIGDPCYVMGDDATSRVTDWAAFCEKLNVETQHFSAPLGKSTGFAVSTGYGDGSYPVTAEIQDCGAWGPRVKSVTITFIEDEKEEKGW